jgi:acyl CoA:acetate/3-ketoacid CoA transferase alpha subunit
LANKVVSSGATIPPWNGANLDGATVAVGGFGPCGVPQTLIDMLVETESAKNLTLVALDVGTDKRGVGKLISQGKVKRMIAAYVGENSIFRDLYFSGEMDVELTPMGTIVQRLRAGGMGK